MKKNIIRFIVYMTTLFLIMMAINEEKGDQFYVRYMDVTDVKPVKEIDEFVTKDGICITEENATAYRGSITSGPNLALEKGKYAFAIKYKTDNPNNYFVIGEPLKMKEDGTIGEIYASQKLAVNENRARVEFTLEQDINNLEINVNYEGGTLEFYGVDMHIVDGYQDTLLLSIGFYVLAGLICFYFCFRKEGSKLGNYRDEIIILLLVVGVSMLPYMNDFLICGHDLQFHLARIEGTYRALTYGEFPVRINSIQTGGYGYATPVMYPQLFIYFPAVLRMMGMSLLNSYKLLLLFVNILTAVIAYFSFRRLFRSRYAGLLGTAFYTLCLYRLSNLFVRQAVGETLAMAALPLVIYGMYEIIWGKDKKWPWAVLGFTLVLQSHILSTFLYGSTTIVFCILFIKKILVEKRRTISLIKAAVLTVLVNLWFLIPFFDYSRISMQLVDTENVYLQDRTTYLSQVFSVFVPPGLGNITGGTTANEMPLTVGWLLLLGAVLFLLLGRNKEKREENIDYQNIYKAGKISLNVATITLIMSSWLFPWNLFVSIKGIGEIVINIQFFWRLLSLASIALCFVAVAACCILIDKYKANGKWIAYAGVFLAVVGCTYLVDSTLQLSGYENVAEAANTSVTDKLYFYDKEDGKALKRRGETITASEGTTAVFSQYNKEGTQLSFFANVTNCGNDPYIEVPLYAYPGYQAFWNDTRLPVSVGEFGAVRLSIPNEGGEAEIRVFFEEPFYWKAGNVISLLTILVMGGYGLHLKFKNNKAGNGKKVIFVIASMAGGGAERVISILANQMVRCGMDVSILMTAEKEKTSVYQLDERICLLPMGAPTGGSLKGRLQRLHRMRGVFLKHRDAVLISFEPDAAFFTVIANLFLNNTLLVSERNDPAACTYKKLRNFIYSRADHLIFQTQDAIACFSKGLQKKGEVIPNPIDANLPEPFYGEREKTIVCVGRLEPQKNHALLLEAFGGFHKNFPEYRLHLYGDGRLKDVLKQRTVELGIENSVVFEGFVKDASARIRTAGMYVLSSDYEGISNSLLEAMAVGLPVISTDCPIGGSKMCITSGENGILVKTKDTEALQEAMSAIAADEVLANKLGKNAAKLRTLYSEEEICERWMSAIEQTVKCHRTNL